VVLRAPEDGLAAVARAGDRGAIDAVLGQLRPSLYTSALRYGGGDSAYAVRIERRVTAAIRAALPGLADGVAIRRAAAAALVSELDRARRPEPVRGLAAEWDAVARLPRELALPLVLAAVTGLAHPEIAAVLGVDVSDVRARLARGREHALRRLSGDGSGAAHTLTSRS
jgi:hypothetical protein